MDLSTAISVLGGVGLFLLGMSVMTSDLKALAGPGLRATLSKAAATPLSATFWGAFVTLLVQSSSATTMTTIGLVSAGLLTFAQGLGLVFGANIGTTGTAWLIALVGVRVSLTTAALPMIFVGALTKLLARGRVAAGGGALAGFALVLFGLTTLQHGMGGIAERLQPSDFPAVFGPDVGWASSVLGVLLLVAIGLGMTAVMQSSTAAIAVTLSAQYAGVVGMDQACALIIGQNIGTATSSALAAIGASRTAQRLALGYILFKIIAALIALVLFPVTVPLIVHASKTIEGVTLLAAYHTIYNVVGVAVMLPLIDRFTHVVERMLPDRGSSLTRCLDPVALRTPLAAAEAARRAVARSLAVICRSIDASLPATDEHAPPRAKEGSTLEEAGEALRQAQRFISEASGPPATEEDEERLTSTLHALDHASRLAEIASESDLDSAPSGEQGQRATTLCAQVMRDAAATADVVGALPDDDVRAGPQSGQSTVQLEDGANNLTSLQPEYRKATLESVARGGLSADEAGASLEALRKLEALARHAWRSAAYLTYQPPPR